MDTNNVNRAPVEARPPSAGTVSAVPGGQQQLPPRPQLIRVDSRSTFLPPQQRAPAPTNSQPLPQRPQFQPGGPVTNPPQFPLRPGTPVPRGPTPLSTPGTQQAQGLRLQSTTVRPVGPQPFASQQGPRPQQLISGPPQRAPPPNNLQFGPRQPPQFSGSATPDGTKQFSPNSINEVSRNGANPFNGAQADLRQSSQGSIKERDFSNLQPKQVILDNQSANNDYQKTIKMETFDVPGTPKSRSYSIAAPPGAPSPLKIEDDRRKSISVVGGRIDEITTRSSGFDLIKESQDSIRGSKESIPPQATTDVPERPESRISSKMSESFIGSLPTSNTIKKLDDDDDVVVTNTAIAGKNINLIQNKVEISDRSPSLSRSEDSPESKQQTQSSVAVHGTSVNQNGTTESQRPKTPKTPVKSESKPTESQYDVSIKQPPRSSISDSKPPAPIQKKPTELNTSDSKMSTPRKTASAPKYRPKDGDNDSGVDESTQGNDLNGSPGSPNKKMPSKLPTKEKSNGSLKPSLSRSSSKSAAAKTPENPLPAEKKKIPMNKVQVGSAPSPNIKSVKSKIGSLENTTYRPGGGKIKIENRKLDFHNVTPKIAAKNDQYAPSGGSKKITTTKLEWNAKSKIGSLQNTTYKPGGGDKKIETVKLDFKEKAKPKVASTVNITHKPGGGAIKIENQKLEFKAQSKVGSLDNVKHKPKGGDVKIFDDKEYIKQMSGQSPAPISRTESRQESPIPTTVAQAPKSDVNLNQQQ